MSPPEVVLQIFFGMNATRCLTIASLAFLLYDHALTIDNEVEYVWNRRWSVGKLLFILNRYLGSLILIFHTSVVLSLQICILFFHADRAAWIFCLLVSEILSDSVILQARIFAVYNRSKKVLGLMMALLIAEKACTLVILYKSRDQSVHNPPMRGVPGCFSVKSPSSPFQFGWLPVLLFETTLCGLMLYKAWLMCANNEGHPLLSLILRDSIFYYASVVVILILNCLIWILRPQSLQLAIGWVLAVPCAAGSRLLLNMRERIFKETFSLPRISTHGHIEVTPSDVVGPQMPHIMMPIEEGQADLDTSGTSHPVSP